ncbi:hypothetical protein EMIT074MI3_21000 [Bacillus licheniformis]
MPPATSRPKDACCPMPEVKESLVITGWKAKIANAKKTITVNMLLRK